MPIKKTDQRSAQSSGRGISFMIVDDHPLWRDTLRKVLDSSRIGKVVGEAGDGEEALEIAKKKAPDVVVMDIDLPGVNGIETTRRLLERHSSLKVLMLAASDEKARVLNSVRAGAAGYLLKTAGSREIVDAVRRIHRGEMVFPPELADVVLSELRSPSVVAKRGLRLILADGSVLFREGLSRVLTEAGFEVIGSVGDQDELQRAAQSDTPDVVIVEWILQGGADQRDSSAAEVIKKAHPGVGVLVLSQQVDATSAVEVLSQAGAGIGYVLKDRVSDVGQLIDAIHRVANGESVIDPEVVSQLASPRSAKNPLDELTEREREILGLMAEGRSNQSISELLFLTPKTVEGHIGHIFSKLGLEPTTDENRRVLAVLTYLRSV